MIYEMYYSVTIRQRWKFADSGFSYDETWLLAVDIEAALTQRQSGRPQPLTFDRALRRELTICRSIKNP